MSKARSGGDMHKAKNLWGNLRGNLQGRRKHWVSHTQEEMEGRNERAGISPDSCWDSWNMDFSGKGLFGTWMSLNTTASSELHALLSPQISTRGIHKSYADFLQPDSASQSVQTTRQTLSSSNSSPEQGCSSRTGTGSSRAAGSEQESVQVEISWFFKKREGLFSTLTIQWLDIPSLHSETIQWGILCFAVCHL